MRAVKGTRHGTGKHRAKRAEKRQGRLSAQAKQGAPHCVSPPPANLDLNELHGIAAQIVAAFCPQLNAGQPWTVAQRWFVLKTFALVPEGFEPAGETPLEDFLAKFAAVKYVIDPGTSQEKTVVFPNDGTLFTRPATVFPGGSPNREYVTPITLGPLQPLSVGDHAVDVSWVFRAMHCDGIAANIDENCLPAGETRILTVQFEVTPGHQ